MKKLIKLFLVIIGTISVVLGVLGIILPVLPTTPFLLLAAFCYVRSSEKLYQRLINHKHLGPYIKNFREGKGIPLRAKIFSMITLWIGIGYTIIFFLSIPWVRVMLFLIASTVSIYILSRKTLRIEEIQ